MKTKTLKTSISMLIVTMCAILFCGLFAINNLTLKKAPTAHAYEAGSSATLRGYQNSYYTIWSSDIDYEIQNLTITNNFDTSTSIGTPVDVSEERDGSLCAYQIDNGDGTYDCVIYADVETIYAPVDSQYLFHVNLGNIKSITFENFDTSKTTNMTRMFYSLKQLETLDISMFDTSSVEYFQEFIGYCSELKAIDFSSKTLKNGKKSWILSSVKNNDTYGVLKSCGKIEHLDLRSWDFSQNTNNASVLLWENLYNLKTLDLSTWIIPANIRISSYGNGMIEMIKAPKECNSKLYLISNTLYEQGTENSFTEISSETNGKVLVNQPNYVPATGFADEFLLPLMLTGVVSMIVIAFGFAFNKKQKQY